MNSAVGYVTRRFRDKSAIGHRRRIGEMHLKNVSARFDVKSDGNGAMPIIGQLITWGEVIFKSKGLRVFPFFGGRLTPRQPHRSFLQQRLNSCAHRSA